MQNQLEGANIITFSFTFSVDGGILNMRCYYLIAICAFLIKTHIPSRKEVLNHGR